MCSSSELFANDSQIPSRMGEYSGFNLLASCNHFELEILSSPFFGRRNLIPFAPGRARLGFGLAGPFLLLVYGEVKKIR